jgi:hypothetical protein
MTQRNERIDLYTPIHKALRRALFDTAAGAARADFALAEETHETAAAVVALCELLRDHAELEDRNLQPIFTDVAPALATTLAAEHVAVEKAAIACEELLPRLVAADRAQRLALGAELVRRLNTLVADHLRHMDREERQGNPVLWSAFDDDGLLALRARMRAQLPAHRAPAWGALFGLALSARERAALAAAPAAAPTASAEAEPRS